MRNYQKHLKQQWQLTETLAKLERDEADSSWWAAVVTQSSWVTWHFHSVIYSVSNEAENYFIRAPCVKCLFVEQCCCFELQSWWKVCGTRSASIIIKFESYFHLHYNRYFPNRYLLQLSDTLISFYESFLHVSLPFFFFLKISFHWCWLCVGSFTCLWSWTAMPIISANAYSPFLFQLSLCVQKNTAEKVEHNSYHKLNDQTRRIGTVNKLLWIGYR